MKYPVIINIIKIDKLEITLQFSDDTIKQVDLSLLIPNKVFEPLKDISFLKQARIDPGGYGISWNEDIDISESYLWDNGITISKPA